MKWRISPFLVGVMCMSGCPHSLEQAGAQQQPMEIGPCGRAYDMSVPYEYPIHGVFMNFNRVNACLSHMSISE